MKIVKAKAKRAFTPTKIPGADYVINQYIGCEHACLYCYAKFVCRWYNYGKWGKWIVIKENLPELVKKEKNVKGKVYMSSISDPYQPIEKKVKLTRKILKNMNKKIKLDILTKSDLVLRDIDVFKEFEDIEVGLTINDFDKLKEIEPFSPSNKKRINALKKLHENAIYFKTKLNKIGFHNDLTPTGIAYLTLRSEEDLKELAFYAGANKMWELDCMKEAKFPIIVVAGGG